MKICMSCGSPVPAADERCQRCGAQINSPANRLTGTIFAERYRIEDWLGSGGMCDVYRARHVVIGKQVAIKVLRPELAADPKVAQRFEQEALAASRVRHPNAIDVTDFGIAEGNIPFIVMELVEGKTLGEILRLTGPLPIERAANILRQVSGALEVAHSVGVIHRDIKPDNILISEYEGGDWVEVADFGVAKIQEDVNRRAALTGANFIIGTPRYMSPEQCDEKPVDARSDIYSLGIVLYEMLSGDTPFVGSSTRLLIAHSAEPPVPLSQKLPNIPPSVEAVVMQALEKDPDKRPQSASEFAQNFLQAAGLRQEGVVEAGRSSGAFSRVSVPLDGAAPAAEGALADMDDEATLVRRPSTSDSKRYPQSGTIPDLSDYNPYNTVPEVSRQATNTMRFPDTAATGDNNQGQRDPLDLAASAEADVRSDRQVTPLDRRARKRSQAVVLIVALLAIAALAAFLIFNNRKPTAGAAPERSASEPAPPAAPADSTKEAAPPQDDGVISTPESASAVTESEEADPAEAGPQRLKPAQLAEVQKQVTATLHRWAGTMENRNLQAHMNFYPATVSRYYLKQDVTRDFVRQDRAKALSVYSDLKYKFSNINVKVLDPAGTRAVATFEKTWDFKGNRNVLGSVVEKVWLEKAGDRWVITGERDLKVNYAKEY